MVFGTAISGIQAATKDLEVIGNNIANSATIGFKSSRAEFADIYSTGAYYGGGQTSIGQGVRLTQVQQMFGQGHISGSSNSLDLAISGSGFFVLSDNGSRLYSRAGAFNVDKNGFIVNHARQNLVGYMADQNGVVGSTTGNLQINMANIAPQETSTVSATYNLSSKSTPPGVDWVGGATPATDTYNSPSSSMIYDSLGNSHVLTMYFIHADSDALAGAPNAASPAGTQNQWYVAFQIDNQNVPANVGANNINNLYRANFNSDGSFAGVEDTTGTALPNNLIPLSMNLSNGANSLNFTVDLSNSTQFGSPFATQASKQDGYSTARISGLDIDAEGVVFGTYDNGQTRAMGQVLLANFSNPNGLQNTGDTTWAETFASGQALIGSAGTASLGLIQSGGLEDSNVDLTSELVKLIGAQRNFQANTQTIKTADAITQTIINIR